MRAGAKPPMSGVVTDRIAEALGTLSKAALIDLYTQAHAVSLGECDTPPMLSDVADDVRPTLKMRGDPIPDWCR